uniref:Orphan G-protein coupled receptor 39 n=1 Tax=Platynereis dumerilii TaxID=6359 RepID=A0A0K0PVP7_PLADU|nr:orphan G-protein coupled receptor 39 [Platynereis dumerilii]
MLALINGNMYKLLIILYLLAHDVHAQNQTDENYFELTTINSYGTEMSITIQFDPEAAEKAAFEAADLPWYIEHYPAFNESLLIKAQLKFRVLPPRNKTVELETYHDMMKYGKWNDFRMGGIEGQIRQYKLDLKPNIFDKYHGVSYEDSNVTVMCAIILNDFAPFVACIPSTRHMYAYTFKPWTWDLFDAMYDQRPLIRQDMILSAILLVLGFTGNFFTVILFNLKRNRTATNTFLGSLAVADFFLVLISVPKSFINFHFSEQTIFSSGTCEFAEYVENVLAFGAINNLVAVSYERFLALVYPMKAHRISSYRRAVGIVIGLWIFSAIEALPMIYHMEGKYKFERAGVVHYSCATRPSNFVYGELGFILYRTYLLFFLFLIPCTMQGYFYIRTCYVLYKTMKESHLTEGQNKAGSDPNEERKKVLMMLMALWIFYIIFWSPRLVIMWVSSIMSTLMVKFKTQSYLYKWSYINNIINFFVYFISSKRLRLEYIRILSCNRIKPKAQIASNATGQSQLSVSQSQSQPSTNI